MKTIELVAKIKANYPTMPSKQEFKRFIWKNNYDVDMSSNEIEKVLQKAYNTIDTSTGYEKKLKTLMEQGCTHKEIMDILGMTTFQVSELKDKYGLSKKRTNLDISKCYEIYECFKENGSYYKTGKQFGIDPKTARSRVKIAKQLKGEM